MGDQLGDSNVVELIGKIMVVGVVVLVVVIIFVFFLHLYAKWFWYHSQRSIYRQRRGLDFAGAHQELSVVTVIRRGLDPSVLYSIPITLFNPKDFEEGLECAVCLCEVTEGEKTRILPKCNHGFHVECIDMWFHSHSTCPLCRNPVSDQTCSSVEVNLESILRNPEPEVSNANVESNRNFPANVLFWGDETQVSTLGSQLEEHTNYQGHTFSEPTPSSSSSLETTSTTQDGMLVIDIPTRTNEQEQKSPVSSQTRSFRRLLSFERWVGPRSNDGEASTTTLGEISAR